MTGTPVVVGQNGAWMPIAAEQTATGYEVAWKQPNTSQYLIWTTDSSGNYISYSTPVSGNDTSLRSAELRFQQDLNGDGVIGIPASAATIELFGSTHLTQIGNQYYLYNNVGSGPAAEGDGHASGGRAERRMDADRGGADGNRIRGRPGSSRTPDQYLIWTTDSSGNYISYSTPVSGNDTSLRSAELRFQQDLNGDGVIGIPASAATIESFGSTDLTQIGNQYYLYNNVGSGPVLKVTGTPVVVGQNGAWMPIAAEQTATGYEVAWKQPNTSQYLIWTTDSSGNYISYSTPVSGNDSSLRSAELRFQQDLNGDGVIGIPTSAATVDSSPLTATKHADELKLRLVNEPSASGVAQFTSEQGSGDWRIISLFDDAGMSGLEGFSAGDTGSQRLTSLLKELQQNSTFATADGAHAMFGNHDSMPTKAFVADLHTGFLIFH